MKADSKIENESNILESPASYYNPVTKKWETGCFILNKNHIQFICNSRQNEQFHLCLPLSTITCIEKRQSNLIYPSLVISIRAEKHWFCSFSSRDAVYNLLELFWRESLISKPHKKPSSKSNVSNSVIGKDLLDILYESEKTLIETANTLSDQSQQLHDAEQDVEDLNHDLAEAEEAIKSLSSPLSLAKFLNCDNKNSKEIESRMQKYKVTYSFSNNEDKVDWEKGTLVICDDIIYLKADKNTIMQVTKNELESFEVLSPWELCITHNFSGCQKSCFFICPQLSRLLKFISSLSNYQSKIIYTDDDSSVYETASSSSKSSLGSALNSPSSQNAHSSTLKKLSPESSQEQVNALSDEDIHELNNVLQNLQILATEVSQEQENQMERIDTLVGNMEKTEFRMKKSNTEVKKIN